MRGARRIDRFALVACAGALVAVALVACGHAAPPQPPPKPKPVAAAPKPSVPEPPLPPHLAKFPGLFVRKGSDIVEAPAADVAVAKSYPRAKEKGPEIDGHRLTILTAKPKVRVGEEVRVIHVHEALGEGEQVWTMGPKPVRGEVLDGKLVTPAVLGDADPFLPAVYDGPVLAAPAVDYNWEITRYRFSAPGRHALQWKLGKFASNVLVIDVVP